MIPVKVENNTSLDQVQDALNCVGYAVVEDVLDEASLAATRDRMYRVQERILTEIGKERLARAGELGVLRLMMKYDPHFFTFLEIPEVLSIVDRVLSETAILHLQNGFILPSFPPFSTPDVFQNAFHQDFPRVLSGYIASVNIMFAIDPFTRDTGATLVVPGSHQRIEKPDHTYLARNAVPVQCAAGSLFVFDSTLWHAAGRNTSGKDRLAINHQFTRSFSSSRSTTSARWATPWFWSSLRVLSNCSDGTVEWLPIWTSITSRRTSDCIGRGKASFARIPLRLFESPT